MKRLIVITACLFAVATTMAAWLDVGLTNANFELTTQNAFANGFDDNGGYDTPGWSDYDRANWLATDCGVENSSAWWGTYNGYSAFMQYSDGAQNMSSHVIETGDVYRISVVMKTWDTTSLGEITLFWDNPTNIIARYTNSVNNGWATYTSPTNYTPPAAAAGGKLGLAIKNVETSSGHFLNFDNVAVEYYVVAPFILTASSPNGTGVNNDALLSCSLTDEGALFSSAAIYLDSLTNSPVASTPVNSGITNVITADAGITLDPLSAHTAYVIATGTLGELYTNSWSFTMAEQYSVTVSPNSFSTAYDYQPIVSATVFERTDSLDYVELYTNSNWSASAAFGSDANGTLGDTTVASVKLATLEPGQVVTNMSIAYSTGAYEPVTNLWAFTMGGATGVTIWNSNAPPFATYYVAQTNGALSDAENVGGLTDNALGHEWTYISDGDRPAQGQIFTTPSDVAGYTVDSIWIRNVSYDDGAANINAAGGTFHIRITNPGSTNSLSFVKYEETLTKLNTGTANTGQWIEFKLSTPVVLNGNTVYGFDIGSAGGQYVNTDGVNNNPYAGGRAYRSGDNGDGTLAIELSDTGDRAFIVQMEEAGTAFSVDSYSPLGSGFVNYLTLEVGITELADTLSSSSYISLDGSDLLSSVSGTSPNKIISADVPAALAPLTTHTATVVAVATTLDNITNSWVFTMGDDYALANQSPAPSSLVLTNISDVSVDLVDVVGTPYSANLYVNGALEQAFTITSPTSSVTATDVSLLPNENTAMVIVDGEYGLWTNSWVFISKERTTDRLWNINIAGDTAGSQPVSDGVIAVGPASSNGTNLWNNVVGANNANKNATNEFVCTDSSGFNPIGFKTYGSQFYGTRSTAEDNIQQQMFAGWVGANAPMNMTGVISNLDKTASYDIYLYSTWHWTENDVTYDIVTGFGSDVGEKICSETRATVKGAAYDDYSVCVEGENYVVYRDVTPTVDGIIAFTGVCPDGVLSGLQIREHPGQGVLPVADVISATPTGTVATNAAVLDVTMVDYDGSVDTNNVMLLLDGSSVIPDSISKSGTTTTVSYATGVLAAGLHTAGVVTAPGENTNEWTFALSYEMNIPTTLAHHWDFEDGAGTSVADIVGGANGTIIGVSNAWTTVGSDGALNLLGGGSSSAWNNTNSAAAGSYVDLPNGIMSNFTGAATIEATFVSDRLDGENWQRVYSFGASTGGEDISDNGAGQIFLTPSNGGALRFDSAGARFDTTPAVVGDITHVVVVLDPDGYIGKCYVNGVLINTVNGAISSLSSLNDINNWFGRSQWNDGMFRGKLLDIRMYTGIMTEAEVAVRYAAEVPSTGPETGPVVSMTVPAGGPITIVWPDDGYSYSVMTNADLTNPSGWGELVVTPYADGGNSVVTNAVGAETSLFYKLQYNP